MSIKTTKNILLGTIVFLTFLTFIQACEKSDRTNSNLIGEHFLATNQAKTVDGKGKSILLTLTDLSDSRCPINANCIWQGVATATIKFKDDTKEQTITLCVGGCNIVAKPNVESIVLNNITYQIKLEDVTPYPGTVTKETAKAKLVISL
jgi:hypothetical protein